MVIPHKKLFLSLAVAEPAGEASEFVTLQGHSVHTAVLHDSEAILQISEKAIP
jgi:hypothetical protein